MSWYKRAARKILLESIANNPNLSIYEKVACMCNVNKILKQIVKTTPIDADGLINLTSKEKAAKKGGEQE